jgi:hypothetical protein
MVRRLGLAVMLLVALSPAIPAAAGTGAWLDAPAPKGWNVAGAKIPRPPKFDPDPFLAKQCEGQVRAAISAADRAVAARGWKLMGAALAFGDTEVVLARSGVDGMCRPLGYQAFVFSGGRFAGTLAPRPMDSRTDGAGQVPELLSATGIAVSFARYVPKDPLCCPSRLSTVRFRIETAPGGPVVTPLSTTTVSTSVPGAEPAGTGGGKPAPPQLR